MGWAQGEVKGTLYETLTRLKDVTSPDTIAEEAMNARRSYHDLLWPFSGLNCWNEGIIIFLSLLLGLGLVILLRGLVGLMLVLVILLSKLDCQKRRVSVFLSVLAELIRLMIFLSKLDIPRTRKSIFDMTPPRASSRGVPHRYRNP